MLKNLFFIFGWLMCLGASQLAYAQVAAPSNGGNISIKQITATSMQLTIGVGGTGQGRVVAMAATSGTAPVKMPLAANTFYSGSPTYGQGDRIGKGYIVYSGPDRTVTITGLQPATYYYFYNAEYNTDSSTVSYNTSGNSLIMRTSAASPVPLPVVLTAFTGTVDAKALATLRWTTASEYNTDYFIVERSADGQEFNEVSRLAAAGSSSQSIAYQSTDPRRLDGPTYYRLRQTDLDSAVHYSSTITLAPLAEVVRRTADIYPNPSTSQAFQLALQGYAGETVGLRVVDALGRPVLNQTLDLTNTYYAASLNLPASLAPGTYTLTIISNAGLLRKKLLVRD